MGRYGARKYLLNPKNNEYNRLATWRSICGDYSTQVDCLAISNTSRRWITNITNNKLAHDRHPILHRFLLINLQAKLANGLNRWDLNQNNTIYNIHGVTKDYRNAKKAISISPKQTQ